MPESLEVMEPMITRFCGFYVRCLFAVELLLFALSLFLNVGVLLGANRLLAEYGEPLLYCAFVVLVPVCGLAKERNVWKNEFKSCPRWLRIAALIFMIYGIVAVPVQTMLFSDGGPLEAQPLFVFGAPLFLESMPLCILYSLLWASPVSATELVKRVRISLIALVVCATVIIAARLGYLPHRSRQE